MMQELRLYDPNRQPKTWTDIIRPGQFAVFHSDLATDVEKTADGRFLRPGEESTCLVFDSLPEAEEYCEAKVEAIPSLRCDIYDHLGKGKPPAMTFVNKIHVNAPRKYALLGWALIAAAVACFWIEWYWPRSLALALILGLNLLFAGLRLLYWGTGGTEKRRATREKSS
jgi:hypothetical protein